MKVPKTAENETARLAELHSFSILDTMEEEDFDNLTAIASEVCQTPIALVSLIDNKRQWFKSHHGLEATETPKEYAFCAHAINDPENVFVVSDSRKDDRFYDNPLVTGDPHVIFYAGIPLISENGYPLGTLCVIDHEPKSLTESQIKSLSALSQQVVNLLKLRKKEQMLKDAVEDLNKKNEELEKFAYIAAHDLNSPLKNIFTLSKLFIAKFGAGQNPEGNMIIEMIGESSMKLKNLVEGLLDYSKNAKVLNEKKSTIIINELKAFIEQITIAKNNAIIHWQTDINEVYTNQTALHQILINLVSNAIKYSGKEQTKLEIGITEKDENYHFYVTDNGIGIDKKFHETIFEIFTTVPRKGDDDVVSNGLGLATVKKMTEALGGSISVESELGEGSCFSFYISK